jgi:hypothetical protein
MSEHEDIKKALRMVCGFAEPTPEPTPEPMSHAELAAQRAMIVWDTIMARNGSMPKALNGEED